MKKIIFILLTAMLFSCSKKTEVYPDFTVDFLDTGKSDSMILHTENGTVLIDCGEKNDGNKILSVLEENGIESVDCLIITHYDKDHVGGASKVISGIDVKKVYAPDYEENSSEMKKYHKALDSENITPVLVTEDISFTLDGVEYEIYAPQKTFYGEDDDNDFSLVTKVKYHNTTMLFTGDAMEQRLSEIMDTGKCNLLKIPYHARKIDNLENFLISVSPQYAVACTSEGEFSDNTEGLLKKYGIQYYATCRDGQITAVSDGNEINISTEKKTYTS